MSRKNTPEDLWTYVDRSGDCWLWMGYRHPYGYGEMDVSGKTYKTHRLAWELTNGNIPEGLWVLHHCDNPPCVNPAHLFLGNYQDNIDDKVAKGRQRCAPGTRNGSARLDWDEVRRIRALAAQGSPFVDLGRLFGVTGGHIGQIVSGHNWVCEEVSGE